jgi:hypothetical protein
LIRRHPLTSYFTAIMLHGTMDVFLNAFLLTHLPAAAVMTSSGVLAMYWGLALGFGLFALLLIISRAAGLDWNDSNNRHFGSHQVARASSITYTDLDYSPAFEHGFAKRDANWSDRETRLSCGWRRRCCMAAAIMGAATGNSPRWCFDQRLSTRFPVAGYAFSCWTG